MHGRQGWQEGQRKEQATANEETETRGTKEAGQGPATNSVAGARYASILRLGPTEALVTARRAASPTELSRPTGYTTRRRHCPYASALAPVVGRRISVTVECDLRKSRRRAVDAGSCGESSGAWSTGSCCPSKYRHCTYAVMMTSSANGIRQGVVGPVPSADAKLPTRRIRPTFRRSSKLRRTDSRVGARRRSPPQPVAELVPDSPPDLGQPAPRDTR
jgi:hypothetical protein